MRILKTLAVFFGSLVAASGLFIAIVGILNGFGDPTLSSRLLWGMGGIACILFGIYVMYVASDKSFRKLFENIIFWL